MKNHIIQVAQPRFYIHILKSDGTTEEIRIHFNSREIAELYAKKVLTSKPWSIVSR
jgi:hypothetical protein